MTFKELVERELNQSGKFDYAKGCDFVYNDTKYRIKPVQDNSPADMSVCTVYSAYEMGAVSIYAAPKCNGAMEPGFRLEVAKDLASFIRDQGKRKARA